mmetsp:Transcript_4118/g.25964  ORF Transcript_4118/g.25964 Transcript_4118/m.25964 type:complete len:391 (+) Transcript_4118:275-1447(+)
MGHVGQRHPGLAVRSRRENLRFQPHPAHRRGRIPPAHGAPRQRVVQTRGTSAGRTRRKDPIQTHGNERQLGGNPKVAKRSGIHHRRGQERSPRSHRPSQGRSRKTVRGQTRRSQSQGGRRARTSRRRPASAEGSFHGQRGRTGQEALGRDRVQTAARVKETETSSIVVKASPFVGRITACTNAIQASRERNHDGRKMPSRSSLRGPKLPPPLPTRRGPRASAGLQETGVGSFPAPSPSHPAPRTRSRLVRSQSSNTPLRMTSLPRLAGLRGLCRRAFTPGASATTSSGTSMLRCSSSRSNLVTAERRGGSLVDSVASIDGQDCALRLPAPVMKTRSLCTVRPFLLSCIKARRMHRTAARASMVESPWRSTHAAILSPLIRARSLTAGGSK